MTRRAPGRGLPEEIHTEGGLLSADFLERLGQARPASRGDKAISGLTPADYHLADRDTIADAMTRAWNELLGHWQGFAARLDKDPEAASRPKDVLQHWLLPLFQTLGYGRLAPATAASKDALRVGDIDYPISHLWQKVPIHLVAWSQDLDRPSAAKGLTVKRSPHGLLQDFLNKSDGHLWGFVSNGRALRILRDHRSLTRAAYVEIDLERTFAGDAYHAFRWLWLLVHESRVDAETPEQFRLEAWFKEASDEGVRALESLRGGVTRAIEVLANGFHRHPANAALRAALGGSSPTLALGDYYRELLRLAYRLIFVFVAEDRDALLDPAASELARARYRRFYTTRRLRDRALVGRPGARGDHHDDLWEPVRLVLGRLDRGAPELGLPALGSALWRASATPHLADVRLSNADLLDAIAALSTTRDPKGLRFPVSWRLVGAEELGSIYESLLELHLAWSSDGAALTLQTAAGHARKTTGSYYTPSSLVECLLDTALDPVVAEAVKGKSPSEAESALLSLSVVDPAVGSGHFLLAAGRRLAKRLAQVRTGEDEPTLAEVRRALRDVVGRCLYGVDLNEMAAELCKVSLWLEAIEPGRPLSFLEAHIQVGNSLLGATPELIAKGIPDEAWQELTGDDKEVVKALKKRNKLGAGGQLGLGLDATVTPTMVSPEVVQSARGVEALPDGAVADVDAKEAAWRTLLDSPEHRAKSLLADIWCAAFVWPKQKGDVNDAAPVAGMFTRFAGNPDGFPEVTKRVARELADRYQFFHWHLRFPAVMDRGGFDVVLGNPPWERFNLNQQEWFDTRSPTIAAASKADVRKKLIDRLESEDQRLWAEWQSATRSSDSESNLIRTSGRYPLCGRGDLNTYAVFAELDRELVSPQGRVGVILPSGIAMDDTTKDYFRNTVEGGRLASLYHFENESRVFPGVHHAFRFCLLTFGGAESRIAKPEFVAYARAVHDLSDLSRRYRLAAADFARLNPNTWTFPAFRLAIDAELQKRIYIRLPVLILENHLTGNPWNIELRRMLHMSDDAHSFRTADELRSEGWTLTGNVFEKSGCRCWPLYEAKMVHLFDHRFGSYTYQSEEQSNQGKLPETTNEQHQDRSLAVMPRYWVNETEVIDRLRTRWDRGWLLGWRDICRASDSRTVIASIFPLSAVGHTMSLAYLPPQYVPLAGYLLANLSSFILDSIARHKIGGTHLTFGLMQQLPVLPPGAYSAKCPWSPTETLADWIRPRVLELVYTAWDMQPFAKDLGFDGPPFRWDDTRRRHLRAELDAAFFHLYGLTRDEAAYVLDTFPIVRRDDEARFGTYLTKDLILAAYDRFAAGVT
ncbi:MAG: N-6 DNA methylase [Deltaproteobacteria bacterium]|nr:N-6 DNA methylase [Deltaproteobacteria bacterium]